MMPSSLESSNHRILPTTVQDGAFKSLTRGTKRMRLRLLFIVICCMTLIYRYSSSSALVEGGDHSSPPRGSLLSPRLGAARRIAAATKDFVGFTRYSDFRGNWWQSSRKIPRLQPRGPEQTKLDRVRQEQIKQSFTKAYDSYGKYAWGQDEIIPISRSYRNPRNGWGATLVDSMSTLYVMGLNDRLNDAIQHTLTVDFQKSRVAGQATSVFETTIRYLGGILSVYELTGASRPGLLAKATEIAQKLETAWIGNSHIPFPWIYFDTNKRSHQETITIAEAGSLTIEFDRLSYWTKNSYHRILADKTSRHIMNNTHIFPGLHPQTLDSATGTPRGDKVGWGANVDSFLEYGVKYWQLIGDDAVDYISYWKQAVGSSITHLLKWSSNKKHPYLVEYSASEGGSSNFMTHLACFAPGNWMLGAKLTNNATVFDLGLKMAETCYDSYNSTKTGLGPDSFSYHEKLYVINPEFILRPEVVESIWYAWRLTGDTIWQERAWEIFLALEAHCKTDAGYHGLYNVNNPQWGSKDETESFLFGELFKYLYLTFTPREYFSLDEWVFSTEAHPFKIRHA